MATAWSPTSSNGSGGSGTVTSVTAADTSIVVAGTATDPTIRTATLDVIATDHPPAAAWSNNSKKISAVANGTLAQDAAAFGQIPAALPPSGPAGGDLGGSYPNPTVVKVTESSGPDDLTIGAIGNAQFVKRSINSLVGATAVTSIAATDGSIVTAGTPAAPTIATGALNAIATAHPPVAAVAMNTQKLTGLAAGTTNGDSVRFEQLATAGPITSVFSRTGVVAAAASDYTLAQIAAGTNHTLALSGGTVMGSLAAGTAGQILTSQGSSADPTWNTAGWSNTFDLVSSSTLTNVFTQSIPANTLGANGGLLVTVKGFYLNNTAAGRGLTLGVQFGATNVWLDATTSAFYAQSATAYPFFMQFLLSNEGATNVQQLAGIVTLGATVAASTAGVGTLSNTASTVAPISGTSAIDTTSAANLIIRAQHSANSGSLQLKGSVHVQVVI
jgi:hypothetical protein